ncbi:hypothetical protein N7492_005425 [Penicillium capsulatum]|uniref:AB hydrolase-1 domain-containing protein n=1 Tax=Penicillium capsulatum TaxID=69766 RepID=A0A9W9IFR7_9EURO|nr:hypothetical protein N7492_005425 [Penicillium capsulatum]KAJ6135478.1 hypothetical protein N7512_000638 [Penicillium capsulatum]
MAASDPELFYQSHNPDGDETILLIHGACGSSAEFEETIIPIKKEGFHLLIPDLPAHGKSTGIAPFTVESASKLLFQLITRHAHHGAVHLVGMSLGAHIAAYMGARAAAGQIRSIIASGYNDFHPPRLLVPLLVPSIYALHHSVQLVTQFQKEIAQWQAGEGSYALVAEVIRTLFDPRRLEPIPVRTLVVAAGKPPLLMTDRVDSAKRLFGAVVGGREQGNRVAQHRGVRHPWHVEEPVQFSEMVVQWVGGHELGQEFEEIE